MAELKFTIIEHLGILSESSNGWTKEINVVSWNNRKPKIDIREWDEIHEKMGKGITLNSEEFGKLKEILQPLNLEKLGVE